MSQNIEITLNKIVNTTDQGGNMRKELKKTIDQNGNMRKELKKTIFETVSTVRNLFHKMKGMLDEKTRQNKQMEKEIKTVKIELHACMQKCDNYGTRRDLKRLRAELPGTVI